MLTPSQLTQCVTVINHDLRKYFPPVNDRNNNDHHKNHEKVAGRDDGSDVVGNGREDNSSDKDASGVIHDGISRSESDNVDSIVMQGDSHDSIDIDDDDSDDDDDDDDDSDVSDDDSNDDDDSDDGDSSDDSNDDDGDDSDIDDSDDNDSDDDDSDVDENSDDDNDDITKSQDFTRNGTVTEGKVQHFNCHVITVSVTHVTPFNHIHFRKNSNSHSYCLCIYGCR